MDGFRRADGGKIAVALIGEDNVFRRGALESRGHGRSAAVGGLHHVAGEIVIGHDRAAHRRHADRPALDAQRVDRLRDEPVDDPVSAAGTIMCRHVCKRMRLFEYDHFSAPPAIRRSSASTSAGVGITPPA